MGAPRKGAGAPAAPARARGAAPAWPRVAPGTLAIVAGLAAALLYLPALQYDWVWDDATLAASHGAAGAAAGGFRPFLALLQRGEWALGAGSPAIFHFTNLVFHAVGTWLFCLLALHLGASAGVAFATALLFGADPVHVESVAFVSGRGVMAATVFSLAALLAARTATLCSPEGCRSRTIYWAYALFAAAVFSHEAALVVPLLLIGLDRWGKVRVPFAQRRVHYAGFFAIALVAILLRLKYPGVQASLADRGLPAGHALQAVLLSAGEYLKMLAWPSPLNAVRALEAEAASSGAALAACAAMAAVIAAFVAWRRGDPAARAGALFLVLGIAAILPYPGTWSSNPYAAERLAYLPAVGFVLLVASLLTALRTALGGARSLATGAALAAAGLAAYASTARMPAWRDNVELLQATAEAAPHDPEPYLQLAAHHATQGDALAALAALDKAIARDSTREEAYSRRALVLGTLQRWPEAEASARRAAALAPQSADAWATLGDALAQQGKSAEAAVASRRAVELDSTDASLWYNLGVSLAATQDAAGAVNAYQRALAIDSTHVGAWNNLGAVYGSMGRLAEARDAYVKAVTLAPGSLQAHMNLALAYLRLGDRDHAAEQRRLIQQISPAAANQLASFFQEAVPKPGRKPAAAPARR